MYNLTNYMESNEDLKICNFPFLATPIKHIPPGYRFMFSASSKRVFIWKVSTKFIRIASGVRVAVRALNTYVAVIHRI